MKDSSKMVNKFLKGDNISISLQYPSEEMLSYIFSIISKIFSRLDKNYLLDSIITILREIILNASKANAKRLIFDELSLNIDNTKEYSNGMNKFKSYINKFDEYKDLLINSNYKINVQINHKDGIEFQIINNISITPEEIQRITYRIALAKEMATFSNVYDKVYDKSEGAGLGLVLIVFLLKNAGIGLKNFSIDYTENEVISTLKIPQQLHKVTEKKEISKKIINEIQALPTFPEQIVELQSLCKNPESSIDTIASKIITDPAITADVLKISNSAGFITGKRIENIQEAIMIIGLNNLESLLTVSTSRKILDNRFKKFESVWDHCNKAAFYARNIAMDRGYPKLADSAFIGGLLHDIGKIVLLSVSKELTMEIVKRFNNVHIKSSSLIEEITIGTSHVEIGQHIAEKWNFPVYLQEIIRYHHNPFLVSTENETLLFISYLADMYCHIESNKLDYSYAELEILKALNIENSEEFNMYHDILKKRLSTQAAFV